MTLSSCSSQASLREDDVFISRPTASAAAAAVAIAAVAATAVATAATSVTATECLLG